MVNETELSLLVISIVVLLIISMIVTATDARRRNAR
jgi:hypothetical protein